MVADLTKNLSPLQQRLIKGLEVLPDDISLCLLNGKKVPQGKNWQNRPYSKAEVCDAITNGVELESSAGKKYHFYPQGYGLMLGYPLTVNGEKRYLLVVDQDGVSAKQKIQEISEGDIPPTVKTTSGRTERCHQIYYVTEKHAPLLQTKKIATGELGEDDKPEHVELLWLGRQAVLPPSVHPMTGCYKYLDCSAFDPKSIAHAPNWVIEQMLRDNTEPETPKVLGESGRRPTSYTAKSRSGEEWTSEEWALSYLSALSPYRADDYDDWLTVGMALHSVGDSLLADWDNWSHQSQKYAPGCCEKKWKSFKRDGKVAIGTLAHMAKQDGWRSPFEKMENFSFKNGQSERTSVSGNVPPQKLALRKAIEKATQIIKAQINLQLDSIEASILLEELRQEAGVNEYNWEQKYLKPLREKLERSLRLPDAPKSLDPTERKRLELKAIAQERDTYKFTDQVIEFCRRTGWTRRDVEQQIRLFKNCTVTPKAKRLKGKDFLALETESISWVFPGIIPSRGVFILGGHAGAGKTTLAYDAVGSLLLREEFLGEKPVKTGKVLVVTGDELPCFTQDKLIERGIPIDNEDWEIVLNWDVSQWDVLEEAIAEIRPTLVVIDSFSSIHRDPSFDENSSQAKSTIYDLEALTNAYGCGCLLIHHLSKSKENQGVTKLRGSGAIAAAASVVCLMEQTSDGSRKLSFPKVRGAQTEPFLVTLSGSTGRYEVVSGGDNAATNSLGERILAFLQKSPDQRYEQEEISGALGIPSSHKDSVYQALGRLFKRGLITKRPSKHGGKRKVYGVVNPAQLSHPSGLTGVTDTFEDTHSPLSAKVSFQIAETVEEKELELTDTLTDTLLTHPNDVQPGNSSNVEEVDISAKLTNTGTQGSVCPPSVKTVTHSPKQPKELSDKEQKKLWVWGKGKWNCAQLVRDNGFGSITIRFSGDSKEVKVPRAWAVPFSAGMPSHAPKGC
jgi:predicted transcriptional regulator